MARATINATGVDYLALEGVTRLFDDDDFALSHCFLNAASQDNIPGNLNGSKLPGGSAHEDACIDGCSPMVHYNSSLPLNNRAFQPNFHPRLRQSVPNLDSTCLNPQSLTFDIPVSTVARGGYKPAVVDPSATAQFQDSAEWGFIFDQQLPVFPSTGLLPNDRDNHSLAPSSTTCDSTCKLGNRCIGVTCADTEDACTDRNCPDVAPSVPPEVASAAAALTSIGGAPGPQQPDYQPSTTGDLPLGLTASHDPFDNGLQPSFLRDDLRGITSHLLWAHGDPASSNCTRPCPIDDPHVFGQCHFPYAFLHDYSQLPSSLPMYPYGFLGPSSRTTFGVGECGAEIVSPDEFIQHFNAEHRQELANVMSGVFGGEPSLASAVPSTSSSANPFDVALMSSQCSLKEPSPITPLSTPPQFVEAGPARRQSLSDHSLPESANGHACSESEHRCLWCDDSGSAACGMTFSDPGELFSHVNTAHIKHLAKGPRGFRCGWENCRRGDDGNDGFPQRSKIERHMQTHIEHKPHSCDHCGKKFSAKQALNQHLLIHSNEKPLVCDWPGCGKNFRQQSALTMHKRVHTGEKPLKCDICGRTFSESSNLSKHKRTHEIKGRFSCPHPGCSRDFHRQDQLRRHMKLHAEKAGSESLDEAKQDDILEGGLLRGVDDSADAVIDAKLLRLMSHTPPVSDQDRQPSRKRRNC